MHVHSFRAKALATTLSCVTIAAALLATSSGLVSASASVAHRSAPAKKYKLNKSPLVFGTDGELTISSADPGNVDAVQAYFNAWNKVGGDDGHPLILRTVDAGTTSSTNLAAIQQLVTADHVLALVGAQGPNDCSAGGPTMAAANVPDIAIAVDASCFDFPLAYPVRPSSVGLLSPLLYYAFLHGAKNFCIQYPQIPTSVAFLTQGLDALFARFGQGANLAWFDESNLSFTEADATTLVAGALSHHCQAVVMNAGLTDDGLILTAAQQAGEINGNLKWLASGLYGPTDIATLGSAGNGAITESFTVPSQATSGISKKVIANVKAANKVLQAVPAQYRDSYAALGYDSAWLLQYALDHIKGNITSSKIAKELGSLKSVSLPLQPTPFNYTQKNISASNPRVVPTGAGVLEINSGSYKVLDPWSVVPLPKAAE